MIGRDKSVSRVTRFFGSGFSKPDKKILNIIYFMVIWIIARFSCGSVRARIWVNVRYQRKITLCLCHAKYHSISFKRSGANKNDREDTRDRHVPVGEMVRMATAWKARPVTASSVRNRRNRCSMPQEFCADPFPADLLKRYQVKRG